MGGAGFEVVNSRICMENEHKTDSCKSFGACCLYDGFRMSRSERWSVAAYTTQFPVADGITYKISELRRGMIPSITKISWCDSNKSVWVAHPSRFCHWNTPLEMSNLDEVTVRLS